MKWSYTKLQIPCPRALSMYVSEVPVEVSKAPDTLDGLSIHDMLESYLKEGGYFPETLPRSVQEFLDIVSRKEYLTEDHFEYNIGDDVVEGRTDLVVFDEGRIRIIDYKTTPAVLIREVHKLQADIYCLNYLLKYPGTRVTYELYFVRKGQLVPVRSYEYGDIHALKRRVRYRINKAKRMLENADETVVTHYCFYCPYVRSCPAVDPSMLDIQAMAEEYLKASAKVKKLGQMLRGALKDKEPIKVGDSLIGYLPKHKNVVDRELWGELVVKLLEQGEKELALSLANPAVKALKKLARKRDEIANMIHTELEYEFKIERAEKYEEEEEA